MATTTLSCPLCNEPCADEFLLAEHLTWDHCLWKTDQWTMKCFCGQVMSNNIIVFMSHLKRYGGVEEHYVATLLGIDP